MKFPLLSSLTLIFSNLFPLYGVFYLDWSLSTALFLYWLENLILGFYNLLKMITAQGGKGSDQKINLIPFFLVHYFLFCAVHGLFVISLVTSISDNTLPKIIESNFWSLASSFLVMFISHGFSFYNNYFRGGEYKKINPSVLLFQPYLRIGVVHLVIFGTALFSSRMGTSKALAVSLVSLKSLLDLGSHLAERYRFSHFTPLSISTPFPKTSRLGKFLIVYLLFGGGLFFYNLLTYGKNQLLPQLSTDKPEVISKENRYACIEDSDCTIASGNCCTCSSGGYNISLNKKHFSVYEKERNLNCKDVYCTTVMSGHSSCIGKILPKCLNGLCQL